MINWELLDSIMCYQHRHKTYAQFLEEIKLERDTFKKDLEEMMPMAAYIASAKAHSDAVEIYDFLSRFDRWTDSADAVAYEVLKQGVDRINDG